MNAHTEIKTVDAEPVKQGFGWLQRTQGQSFEGFDGMVEFLKKRSQKATQKIIKNSEFEIISADEIKVRDDANRLAVVMDDNVLELTHWSFGQLCGLAKAPAGHYRQLAAPLVKDNLNWMLKHVRDVENVMPYYDDEQLRAITGPSYGRVPDWEVAEALSNVLDTTRWVPAEAHMGFRATDRTMQLFLIDQDNPIVVGQAPDKNDDVMYRGLRISNSELGHSSLVVDAFMFRSYCLNGCIFGMKADGRMAIRHTSGAPERWAREIQPALEAYANEDGSKLVDHVAKLKANEIASSDDAAIAYLNNRGLSKPQARNILQRIDDEEGDQAKTETGGRSAWALTQGVTSLARDVLAVEERADMERIGGILWRKVA